MQSALIADAVVLAAVPEADLGRHRKITRFCLLRPVLLAAAVILLYLTAITTHGTGVAFEASLAAAGTGLGLLSTWFMTACRGPGKRHPVSRAVGTILTRAIAIAARPGHLLALTPDGNLPAPQAA
jgi:hypothetical protein